MAPDALGWRACLHWENQEGRHAVSFLWGDLGRCVLCSLWLEQWYNSVWWGEVLDKCVICLYIYFTVLLGSENRRVELVRKPLEKNNRKYSLETVWFVSTMLMWEMRLMVEEHGTNVRGDLVTRVYLKFRVRVCLCVFLCVYMFTCWRYKHFQEVQLVTWILWRELQSSWLCSKSS